MMEAEERVVAPRGGEAEHEEMRGEVSKPRSRCLLEAVVVALEFADRWFVSMKLAGWAL